MSAIRCNSRIKSCRNKKGLQITKIKAFIDKYNQELIIYPSQKTRFEKNEKNNLTIALNFCMLKKKTYILRMFQNII